MKYQVFRVKQASNTMWFEFSMLMVGCWSIRLLKVNYAFASRLLFSGCLWFRRDFWWSRSWERHVVLWRWFSGCVMSRNIKESFSGLLLAPEIWARLLYSRRSWVLLLMLILRVECLLILDFVRCFVFGRCCS